MERRNLSCLFIAQIEEVMMKKLFIAGAFLATVAQAQAAQNYNYSYFQVSGGFDYREVPGAEIDGQSYSLGAQYELEALPVVLKADFNKGSFEQELVKGTDWDYSTFSLGMDYVFSASEKVDFLPGIMASKVTNKIVVGDALNKIENTVYTASLNTRYHLEKGLWLNAVIAHESFKDDDIDSETYFSVGAEYKVDEAWAFGLSHTNKNDEGSTRFLVKIFY